MRFATVSGFVTIDVQISTFESIAPLPAVCFCRAYVLPASSVTLVQIGLSVLLIRWPPATASNRPAATPVSGVSATGDAMLLARFAMLVAVVVEADMGSQIAANVESVAPLKVPFGDSIASPVVS